jgi:hypothetical protein
MVVSFLAKIYDRVISNKVSPNNRSSDPDKYRAAVEINEDHHM